MEIKWYYSISQQTRHLRDIAAILHTLGDSLDQAYIDTWVQRKGLVQTWQALKATLEKQ